MFNFNNFITFEYESAYDCAYDLPVKKKYSTPKIYTANGNLKKRWYVYFYFRNPKTGKMKRVTPFYGKAHRYKTKDDRLFVLTAYKIKIIELLKKGYNPFEDNTQLYQKHQELQYQKNSITKTLEPVTKSESLVSDNIQPVATNHKTIEEAFEFALF